VQTLAGASLLMVQSIMLLFLAVRASFMHPLRLAAYSPRTHLLIVSNAQTQFGLDARYSGFVMSWIGVLGNSFFADSATSCSLMSGLPLPRSLHEHGWHPQADALAGRREQHAHLCVP
jgi:hypothetical protein